MSLGKNGTNIDLELIRARLFNNSFLAPAEAAITLTSGAGAWELGPFSLDFIAAGAIPQDFVICGSGFGNPSANGDYTVLFYAGADDLLVASIGFNRSNPFFSSIFRDCVSNIIPGGSRIRAKLMQSAGGAATCIAKIYYQVIP
jgi:hypothetical protein